MIRIDQVEAFPGLHFPPPIASEAAAEGYTEGTIDGRGRWCEVDTAISVSGLRRDETPIWPTEEETDEQY